MVGTCRIHIHGETTPCSRMDEGHQGLCKALVADWGGGVYSELVVGGEIMVGDPVVWLAETTDDGQPSTSAVQD